MKLREICIREFQGEVTIVPVEYSDEEFYDSDGYSVWEQALSIANQSGIHINRNKELLLVAKDEKGAVLGAVWNSVEEDDEHRDTWVFDFDVAVDPKARGSAKIGIRLIDETIEEFENLKSELGRVYIKVWVINPKLAHWLEYRRGFEPVAEHGDGSAHMVYYGDMD
jgi:ribosomal protein S18 acetylase RimI-like enzyme